MFTCPHCPKSKFSKIERLYDHQFTKHSRIPGSCPLCEARFPSRAALVNEHIIEHMLQCSTCGKGFVTEQGLQSHRENKHPPIPISPTPEPEPKPAETRPEERLAFTCSHCEWICFTLEASQKHEADNHSIPCKHCEHRFATYATRDQHEALHLEYKCVYCDWEFSSEDTLDQHISDLHSSRCKYCGSQLSSVTARNEHYKSCEYATPPCYTCTPCNRRFSSAAALDAHGTAKHRYGTRKRTVPSTASPTATSSQTAQRASPFTGGAPTDVPIHAGGRSTAVGSASDPEGQGAPGTQSDSGNIEAVTEEDQMASYCSSCRVVYESYEDSLTHTCKFVKTEIPLHCAYCYSRFVDGVSLVNHLAERDTFRCTVCDVQFCFENLLHDHLETHPQCRTCEESFADETELYRHMEVEHPVVVCWDCGGAVICQESLDLHYASEHPSCTLCGSIMGSPDMLPEV
ncbi:hypothetical protein EDD17DRAFT_24351 [Pisolithus thermaeus]|nr:hypothetical protein EDD17DRAFT_24351 [Pisolithus thermaeus]